MNGERELLSLAGSVIRFATYHPYAATGIFGAAVGSAVTYKVLTSKSLKFPTNGVFTPKVYEVILTDADLRNLQADIPFEIRIESSDMTVVVTSEKREVLKQIPDIIVD